MKLNIKKYHPQMPNQNLESFYKHNRVISQLLLFKHGKRDTLLIYSEETQYCCCSHVSILPLSSDFSPVWMLISVIGSM